jgi:hypothetical protein
MKILERYQSDEEGLINEAIYLVELFVVGRLVGWGFVVEWKLSCCL